MELDILKKKLKKGDPFGNSFSHLDISQVSEGPMESVADLTTPRTDKRAVKAKDKHNYAAVPFEYRPGQ